MKKFIATILGLLCATAIVVQAQDVKPAKHKLTAEQQAVSEAAAPASAAVKWVVHGRGFGHGVGMSAYGAYGYAKHGAGYEAILGHYYPGTSLGTLEGPRIVRVLLGTESGDVGFSGYWTLEMFAVHPIRIYPGIPICQIFYHEIAGPIEEMRGIEHQEVEARAVRPKNLCIAAETKFPHSDAQLEATMASPMIEFCEQANPKILNEVGRTRFQQANRVQQSLLSRVEKRTLIWMAERTPAWINSDHLTLLGLAAQIMAGVSYALAHQNRNWLLAVIVFLALNWLGDSLDGTLARVRQQQRPRYGFYVDHMVDAFGALTLMGGLAISVRY